jgi:regulator of nonsense transcripts 1
MHISLKIVILLFIIGVVYFIFSLNLNSKSNSITTSVINNRDLNDTNLKFFVPLKPKVHFSDKNEYYNYFMNLLNYKIIEKINIDKGSLKLIKKQSNALVAFKDPNLRLNNEIVRTILNSNKNIFKSKEYYYYADPEPNQKSLILPLINKVENIELSEIENDEKINENDEDYKVSDIDQTIFQSNNKSQNKAIENVLNNSFTLIQGPPGTGKSKVSVDIIYSLLTKYPKINKILISGPSNKAVDSLTKTLVVKYPTLKPFVCRFYSNSALRKNPVLEGEQNLKEVSLDYRIYEYLKLKRDKTNMDISMLYNLETNFVNKNTFNKDIDNNIFEMKYNKDYYYYRNYYQTLLLNNFKIICATCDASGDEKLNNTLFDVILIDEAAQSNENITLIPIVKGSENCRLVLVGDHKQLGPIDEFDTSKQDQNENKKNKRMNAANNLSMFERLIEGGIQYITLNVQYRMYSEIAELPYDRLFYTNENVDIISGAPKRLDDSTKTGEKDFVNMEEYWNNMSRGKNRFVFIDITGDNSSEQLLQNPNWKVGPDDQGKPIYNQKEIDVTLSLLNSLINEYKVNPKDIGIITAYAGQKNMLKDTIKNIDNVKNVEVNTVDGYQGDQKDYIIFSTVRSNNEGDIGFLNDDRRVNVALTRAKYGLFILGNRETLNKSKSVTWKDIVDYYQRQGSVVDAYYFLN